MAAPAGAGPPPAPDMSHVDPGLQPLLITLLYLFPGLALLVLLVRFWRKSVDRLLGGGGFCRSQIHCMVTDSHRRRCYCSCMDTFYSKQCDYTLM
jgi:hypothetical protein